MLKEEMECVLDKSGGRWTLESMREMKKMDSFIKETLRYNGHLTGKFISLMILIAKGRNKEERTENVFFFLQTATFQRKALRPIALSDGTSIPPGTYTFSPAHAINFDPTIYANPQTFDGMRFYNLRRSSPPENEKRHQLTSVTKTEMQFGGGRHACPGRWFASHQIKMVLAAVIGRFEVRLKDGEGRPESIVFQTNQLPDPKAEILFKDINYSHQ